MAAIIEIQVLLKEMKPVLDRMDYVFSTKKCFQIDEGIIALSPIATFLESEGMTVVVSKMNADKHKLSYDTIFNKITLEVHSSLEAVGLTSAISTALASRNISANVIDSLLNAFGAVFILISLYFKFNLSAFIIEFFWLIISIYGMY